MVLGLGLALTLARAPTPTLTLILTLTLTLTLDRSGAYLAGGVCAVSLDTGGIAEPRTACFDTTVAAQGPD